jgi:very-short-patch-repair endonuclease
MNFGPLNADGGERRLNVLITRSRLRCEVFTNLTADDIDLNRTQARGVVAFKRFLKYAQTGIMDVPVGTDRASGSPFEDAVAEALRRAGYTVEGQVGSAGFFIDLAIVDPDRPGRYLLGIECDGASYHSARSARDRDRLRQQVLEGLGWKIHRIWSTDWFRNADRELKRVVSAIESAAARGDTTEIPVPVKPETTIERVDLDEDDEAVPANSVSAYVLAEPSVRTGGLDLHAVPIERLAGWVVQVVEVEGPVHIEDAIRRITDAAGIGRIGSRIRAALEAAIVRASLGGSIEQRGPFLWSTGMSEPPLRDRSAIEGRALPNVAPEEIAVAIRTAIANAYGIQQSEVAAAACRLLGFPRLTEDMRATVDPLIESMLTSGQLQRQGNHVTVA